NRVAMVADYTAVLDASRSFVRVGDVGSGGTFSERARSALRGLVAFNVTETTDLELAAVQTTTEAFVIASFLHLTDIRVQQGDSLGLRRAVAYHQADGTFSLPAGDFPLAAQVVINGLDTTTLLMNERPFRVTWDPGLDVLTLDGAGDDGAGHGAEFHLEARIT